MEKYKLGDIAPITQGTVPVCDHYWLLNLDAVESNTGKVLEYVYVDSSQIGSSTISFDKSNVLYSKLRPYLNKVVLPDKEGYATSEMLPLKPNNQIISRDYLAYFLRSPHFVEYINGKTSGAKMPRANISYLKSFEIECPTIENQARIVAQFRKIEAIIEKRQRELLVLDELVKARFVEMFGDPVQNPKGWDEVNISTVLRGKASNGFFAKREDYLSDGNVSILGVAYIVNRMYSQIDNLPRTNASLDDIQKFSVQYGDMLFCRSSLVAEGIGKASIVPKNTPKNILFECHVIRLPLDLEKCIPEFLQVLSTTAYFRRQMIAQSKTATMTTIGQEGILKATIILPPMDKQKDFYVFVSHINKMKSTIEKALEQSQLLFDSLMQENFG